MLGVFDKPSCLQQPTVVYNTVNLNLDTHINSDTVKDTVKNTDIVNVNVTDTVNKKTETVPNLELSDVKTPENNPKMENTEVNLTIFFKYSKMILILKKGLSVSTLFQKKFCVQAFFK